MTIYISKKRNGYEVELSPYHGEDEVYLYLTKEEMVAALPSLVDQAEKLEAEERAAEEAKQAAKE